MMTVTAASIIVAFLALSFLGWHHRSSQKHIFRDIALFIAAGLSAKATPLLGIILFFAIAWMSVARFVNRPLLGGRCS